MTFANPIREHEDTAGGNGLRSKIATFSVGEVAKVFFNRTSYWLRWLENDGYTRVDGNVVANRRKSSGARIYDLDDVSALIEALYRNRRITEYQADLAMAIVTTMVTMRTLP